ncbi:RNI-like protein [Wolfiporia cocos MD-104 SS10]|uniref:RNI-like protein n=1 Tax=Wolfiporia cocos (strain MD-104) TaxID=742152 RepID=A0A2H3J2R7_WOLCO|nr:RNI-like protein [Wolfiporia cocos MD-104 SS10]
MDPIMRRERSPSTSERDIGCWLCYSRRLWVPTDIWEDILGMFKDRLEVMAVCGRVCKAWRAITTRYTHIDHYRVLHSPAEVLRFSQLSRAGILHMESVTVSGSISDSRTNRSLGHVAAFAAMLAGNVPRALQKLSLEDGEWLAGIPRSVFLHLATFTPITKLTLNRVEFPSIGVFDRLVCALSHLEQLDLSNVSLRDAEGPDPRSVFSHLAAPITKLTLNHVELPANGVFDRLVCALSHLEQLHLSNVSLRDAEGPDPRSVFSHLAAPITKLTLNHVELPANGVFDRLVCALPHLEQLYLSRVSFRDAEGPDPRSVFSHLAAPITELRLSYVEFPSIGVFGRLVCALSHLEQLDLCSVSFRDAEGPDPRSVFSHLAAPITELRLDKVEFPANGVFDRLVCALPHLRQLDLYSVFFRDAEGPDPRSIFSHLAAPITELTLNHVELPANGVFDRLVCALSHLEQLHLNCCFFPDVQTVVPLRRHWNTPPNLHQIQVDQSRWYSASHIFQALAANKTIACCRQLVSCLGRGSEILLDSVKDISLQRVLDCAGDSLQTLKLGLLLPSPNPGLDRADIERLVGASLECRMGLLR